MNSTFNGTSLWQALLLAVLSVCYPWVVEAAEQQTFPELFPASGSETLPEKLKGELLYSNPLAEPADGAGHLFFAAKGINGESIFAESLPKRDGTFDQYTLGKIRSYHISYYANAARNKDRGHANLRKNNIFQLVQQGEEGIPTRSTAIHKIRLIKDDARVVMYVDQRKNNER